MVDAPVLAYNVFECPSTILYQETAAVAGLSMCTLVCNDGDQNWIFEFLKEAEQQQHP